MNDNNAPHYTELPIAQLEENKGQVAGLPANPRNIQPDKLAKLKRSILDNPEMLQLRGILVYPHGDKYIVIGGNMRLRAMVELGMTSAPCVVIPSHVTADKLRAYTILDNSSMGEWDWQA
ncbi:MAG: ParB/RepB/Spo0J family partition protein, partial [Prevotellaceae bacterium]|nr:ParB/RepB/Spo0J family partition protein [Prevotellaceae bacterium]